MMDKELLRKIIKEQHDVYFVDMPIERMVTSIMALHEEALDAAVENAVYEAEAGDDL